MEQQRRKRASRSLPLEYLDTFSSNALSTKEEEQLKQKPPTCPPLPPKMRRRNNLNWRNLFCEFGRARAVNFDLAVPLSPLYDRSVSHSYVNQIFVKQRTLGEGSFGLVCKVCSKEDKKEYALKIMKENHSGYFERFTEVRNLEKVGDSPYCIKYFGAWEEHGRLNILLELCEVSLHQFSLYNHKISETQIWDVMGDILLGLKHLHDKNFIHLDVKPENIMISSEGLYKIGDFGLLVDLTEQQRKMKNKKTTLDLSEGDSKYLAPEVLQNVYTPQCDIFSLGITLLELTTDLLLPSNGPLWRELRKDMFPDKLNNNVSNNLVSIIKLMMTADYKKRPRVKQLLRRAPVKRLFAAREIYPRINFLQRWKDAATEPIALFETDDEKNSSDNKKNEDTTSEDTKEDVITPKPPIVEEEEERDDTVGYRIEIVTTPIRRCPRAKLFTF